MYMKVATVEIAPGKMDEYLRLFQAAQVPAMQAARGFQEARLLTDAHTGKVMSITLWETEADAKAAPAQPERYGDLLAKPPTFEYYELSIRVEAP
jgi:heme-degrading monooxygenase HmoA